MSYAASWGFSDGLNEYGVLEKEDFGWEGPKESDTNQFATNVYLKHDFCNNLDSIEIYTITSDFEDKSSILICRYLNEQCDKYFSCPTVQTNRIAVMKAIDDASSRAFTTALLSLKESWGFELALLEESDEDGDEANHGLDVLDILQYAIYFYALSSSEGEWFAVNDNNPLGASVVAKRSTDGDDSFLDVVTIESCTLNTNDFSLLVRFTTIGQRVEPPTVDTNHNHDPKKPINPQTLIFVPTGEEVTLGLGIGLQYSVVVCDRCDKADNR